MFHTLFAQGNLAKKLQLGSVEVLSLIIAGACHDYGHDGYTNEFHKKTMSERAIRFNDQSVQENYHASETFSIIRKEETNFLDGLNMLEQKLFRRRAIEAILATDLSFHFDHQLYIQKKLDEFDVQKGENFDKLITGENQKPEELFKKQQTVINYCMHACDVSQQTRNFKLAEKWTGLLFEEFFHQGDMEKELGVEVAMLCDRVKDANISGSQPGFINFIVQPTWTCMARMFPHCEINSATLVANLKNWDLISKLGARAKRRRTVAGPQLVD
jgi:calcium/calmodulin-dependent 3',5'-cyclic nucleotide phosphodiesterase